MDVAEAFRDLPGLALLESGRPGRKARWSFLTADPVAVLDDAAPGADPFAEARRLVARLDPARPVPLRIAGDTPFPPFLGGLVGYPRLRPRAALERLPTIAADDQGMPIIRLALHDWVIAWDRRSRSCLAGGPRRRWRRRTARRRLADVRARLGAGRLSGESADPAGRRVRLPLEPRPDGLRGRSGSRPGGNRAGRHLPGQPQPDGSRRRSAATRGRSTARSERVIRRCSPPTSTSDPAVLEAARGPPPGHRVRVARAVPGGRPVGSGRGRSDQGHPPAWADPGGGPSPRRRAAGQRQGSGRERDDRRRPAQRPRPGLPARDRPRPAPVPARTDGGRPASRVDGDRPPGVRPRRVRPPGGELPRREHHRRAQDPGDGDPREARAGPAWPVHRRGAVARAGRRARLVHPHPDVRGRWAAPVAHVGGGITWRSDPAEEWDETVAKAHGPLRAIDGREVD